MAGISGSTTKKLSVKLKKRDAAAPASDFFTLTWTSIKTFVEAVHAMQFSGHSFEELYTAISNIVATQHGAELYAALKQECAAHIASVASSFDKPAQVGFEACCSFRSLQVPDRYDCFLQTSWRHLEHVFQQWKNHCEQMALLRAVFLCLDTSFVRNTAGAMSLWYVHGVVSTACLV
jgi:cullin 4